MCARSRSFCDPRESGFCARRPWRAQFQCAPHAFAFPFSFLVPSFFRSPDLPYFFGFSLFANLCICAFLAIWQWATSPHGEALRSTALGVSPVQATRICGEIAPRFFPSRCPICSLPVCVFVFTRVSVVCLLLRKRLACSLNECVHSPSSRVSECPECELARHHSSGIKRRGGRRTIVLPLPLVSFHFLTFCRFLIPHFLVPVLPSVRFHAQGWRSGCVSHSSFAP